MCHIFVSVLIAFLEWVHFAKEIKGPLRRDTLWTKFLKSWEKCMMNIPGNSQEPVFKFTLKIHTWFDFFRISGNS